MTITVNWTVIAALLAWTALVFWLGRRSGSRDGRDLSGPPSGMVMGKPHVMAASAPTMPPADGIPPDRMEAIVAALKSGNKIMAIKLFREATGVGLAEAKAAVEAMER